MRKFDRCLRAADTGMVIALLKDKTEGVIVIRIMRGGFIKGGLRNFPRFMNKGGYVNE
jgi:hypothetical protein